MLNGRLKYLRLSVYCFELSEKYDNTTLVGYLNARNCSRRIRIGITVFINIVKQHDAHIIRS